MPAQIKAMQAMPTITQRHFIEYLHTLTGEHITTHAGLSRCHRHHLSWLAINL